jgi:hypothetical protein
MPKPKPIDVTDVMAAEERLMRALGEWRDAGAPVVDVVDSIARLVDAKMAQQKRPRMGKEVKP